MADRLLDEVDEALRADRAGALWAKYRSTIILCAVALIVGTAANSIWQHYREARGGEAMMAMADNQRLLAEGKAKDAAAGFGAIAEDNSGELRDLARIWQGRALIAAEDKPAAIDVFKQAASEGKSLWADIACLRLAGLDGAAAKECLGSQHDSPLAAERAQWSAANLWASGDSEGATKAIQKLIEDPDTNPDARAQLTQWLATINAQKGTK